MDPLCLMCLPNTSEMSQWDMELPHWRRQPLNCVMWCSCAAEAFVLVLVFAFCAHSMFAFRKQTFVCLPLWLMILFSVFNVPQPCSFSWVGVRKCSCSSRHPPPPRPYTQTHTTHVKTPFDRLFKKAFMIIGSTQKSAFPPYKPSPGNRNLQRSFAATAALV